MLCCRPRGARTRDGTHRFFPGVLAVSLGAKGVDMGLDLRSAGRAFFLSGILLALALSARTRALPVAMQNPAAEDIPGLGFRITLGQGDDAPRDWSGEITLSGGRISRLEG